MAVSNPTCLASTDNSFGPWAGDACRGGFDFTLLFEETILTLPIHCLLILVLPLRILQLAKTDTKVVPSLWQVVKLLTCACFVLLNAALLGLWASSSKENPTRTTATIPTASIVFIASLGLCLLSWMEHNRTIRPSSLLSFFLGLSSLLEIARARTLWMAADGQSAIPALYICTICLRLLSLAFESVEKRDILRPGYKPQSKEARAGPFNRAIFFWLNELLLKGYKNILTLEDLHTLDDDMRSELLGKTLSDTWDAVPDKTVPGVLFSAALKAHIGPVMAPVMPRLVQSALLYAQPFLVKEGTKLARQPKTQHWDNVGYGLIGAYGIVYIGLAIASGQYDWRRWRGTSVMRGSIIALIYRKSLRLDTSSSDGKFNHDAALTMIGTDTDQAMINVTQLHEVWIGLLEIGVGIFLLYRELGAACAMPVAVAIAAMFGTGLIAGPLGSSSAVWIQASQDRVSQTSKTLSGVKWLRISGLNDRAFDLIHQLRIKELRASTKFRYVFGAFIVLMMYVPIWAPILSFCIYATQTSGGQVDFLSFEKAFSTMTLFYIISRPLATLQAGLTTLAISAASFQRIQDFLNRQERKDTRAFFPSRDAQDTASYYDADGDAPVKGPTCSPDPVIEELPKGAIATIQGQFHWPPSATTTTATTAAEQKQTEPSIKAHQDKSQTKEEIATPPLSHPTLNITNPLPILRNRLTLLLGPVGCGKSTFLRALLGESSSSSSSISLSSSSSSSSHSMKVVMSTQSCSAGGSEGCGLPGGGGVGVGVAYCAQTPWLPNATVRQVILGAEEKEEEEHDKTWYGRVVKACALDRDIREYWPLGEETVVGTKGVAMSGGQKHRLALARALYARKGLLILDDVFSGLDSGTTETVLDGLFSNPEGLVRTAGMTVVAASSDTRCASFADEIVVLTRNGEIERSGSPRDLAEVVAGFQSTQPRENDFDGEDTTRLLLPGESLVGVKKKKKKEDNDESTTTTTTTTTTNLVKSRIEDEQVDTSRQMGDMSTYVFYGKGVGWLTLSMFGLCMAVYAFSMAFPSIWLKWWSQDIAVNGNKYLGRWLGVLVALGIAASIAVTVGIWQIMVVAISNSGVYFHELLLRAAARAPMSFHTSVDTGVTVNRFSHDIMLIDMELPVHAFLFTTSITSGLAEFIIISVSSKYLAAILPLILLACYLIGHFYLRTSRQMRLLDIEHKAPLVSQLIKTLDGLSTIRTFQWEDWFESQNMRALDNSQRPNYLLYCLQRWLTFGLDMIVAILAIVLIALTTSLRHQIGPGYMGIALSSILSFSTTVTTALSSWTEMEIALGAIARIKAFSQDTPAEYTDDDDDDDENSFVDPQQEEEEEQEDKNYWPSRGAIEIQGVTASYSPSSGKVLDNISLSIPAGTRVALVGRTGSGKSSLAAALLRMLPPLDGGVIVIDGIDIATLHPERVVRRGIVALPQEPFIFDGESLRWNVDPFSSSSEEREEDDEKLVEALHAVGLWEKILGRMSDGSGGGGGGGGGGDDGKKQTNEGEGEEKEAQHHGKGKSEGRLGRLGKENTETKKILDAPITDKSFFSQGEAQLLVFARAMVRVRRRSKRGGEGEGGGILILDEFTSSLDEEASSLVHSLLREHFQGWTILSVTHKLDSSIIVGADGGLFDRVAVLDGGGKLVEYDEPGVLLEKRRLGV